MVGRKERKSVAAQYVAQTTSGRKESVSPNGSAELLLTAHDALKLCHRELCHAVNGTCFSKCNDYG